jgi:hypothetical protein
MSYILQRDPILTDPKSGGSKFQGKWNVHGLCLYVNCRCFSSLEIVISLMSINLEPNQVGGCLISGNRYIHLTDKCLCFVMNKHWHKIRAVESESEGILGGAESVKM